jgi:hypothetical protein
MSHSWEKSLPLISQMNADQKSFGRESTRIDANQIEDGSHAPHWLLAILNYLFTKLPNYQIFLIRVHSRNSRLSS